MYIQKLMMVEVANLEEVYRRPFELTVDGDIIRLLEDAISRDAGQFRPQLVLDAVGRGLTLSSDREKVSLGAGKFSDSRFRFILEVVVDQVDGTMPGSRLIVCGYTDRVDMSHNDRMAPDMRFYVNNVVGIRDIPRVVRGRKYIDSQVVDNFQILLGEYNSPSNTRRGQNEYLMRPRDVFRTIEKHTSMGDLEDDSPIIDTRTMFCSGVETNRGRNNQRARYLSTLMEADRAGKSEQAVYGDDLFEATRDSAASDVVSEPRIIRNPFLQILSQRSAFQDEGCFEYRDMVEFTHLRSMTDLDKLTQFSLIRDNQFNFESERWNDNSAEVITVATFCQEIPALMVDCLFSYLNFKVSNLSLIDGQPEFEYIEWGNFVELHNNDRMMEAFKNRFIREIFNLVTNDDQLVIDLEIEAEVGGMTAIEVSFDGGRFERYTFPSFCDGIVAPVVTDDANKLENIARKYGSIRKDIVDPLMLNELILPESGLDRRLRGDDKQSRRDTDRGNKKVEIFTGSDVPSSRRDSSRVIKLI